MYNCGRTLELIPNSFYLVLVCSVPGVKWSVMAERSSVLDSSSGVVRMRVRIPAWPVAQVSLSKTLDHNCFVLRMGRKAVWSRVLCNARKRTQDTYREREGACPGVSGFAP